ncbi:Enoyl-CoA hydratase/carnithine racemase [Roseovarius nanhaiticus]|uniref:Enoyl-CoA hydratase/carnithine racemase n=1 Tax=Roseovarius nanhaiticus TaxID=573024 RepID=A0A1N7F6K5_9RHOB|nr:enoyl-CoA hydratase/isomerase family protein [Roseovarius nanhaiticus]SEK60682.1 Enoyl-CoA hydratase/carnithine racemase [Roseovarius nanhaiticus]SIR95934.1 Enoyl-CoA hydratase/carnithine racemase [Roseovarius nanhaiticus]
MIALERDEGIWTATIDRADKAGALTEEMLTRLAEIAEAAGGGDGARLLILTGVGKVFSAGADLGAMQGGLATSPVWERLSSAITALPCLSIAALNGTVAGGAIGMVLACDFRVAVPTAQIFYPVMQRGFLPQPSDPARLAALVGPARARRVLLAGERVDAQSALDWGLYDRIAAPEDLTGAAMDLADHALGASPAHVAAIKRLIP